MVEDVFSNGFTLVFMRSGNAFTYNVSAGNAEDFNVAYPISFNSNYWQPKTFTTSGNVSITVSTNNRSYQGCTLSGKCTNQSNSTTWNAWFLLVIGII